MSATAFQGLNTLAPIQFFGICFVILCVVLYLTARLQASPFGLALNACAAIRYPRGNRGAQSDAAAADGLRHLGRDHRDWLGALFADLNRFVSPSMFSWQLSGELIVLIVIGGVGRLMGPVIGAVRLRCARAFPGRDNRVLACLAGWCILLCIVLFGRGGLIGLLTGREGCSCLTRSLPPGTCTRASARSRPPTTYPLHSIQAKSTLSSGRTARGNPP